MTILGIGFLLIVIYAICSIKSSTEERKFMSSLKVGTPIKLKYYCDNGEVEAIFRATIKSFEGQNKCTIVYSDGSTSSEDISGWIGLYEKGWRLDN